MPRRKILSDSAVLSLALDRLAAGGERALTFGAMARASGLAASTLVQRFGTQEAMVTAALAQGWETALATLDKAETEAALTPKGALALLKALPPLPAPLATALPGGRDADRAALWRLRVEAALACRLGGGAKAAETAAILFAFWQGQSLWHDAGGRAARLKDVLRRLS
ncbi:transcriptional regulator [Szabonella alba]|uniref:Transcriptional regulator n=1 Tax=Szabonella alba TaxID=2804194 RepID=A0A8K0V9P0_9RHOB|nr:transcriptional regulator [Szabonella alba]MBL4918037.1 transcriptional regulator [Szabonella alba]